MTLPSHETYTSMLATTTTMGKTLFYALPKETYKSIISFTPIKQDLQAWEAILEVQETLL